MNTDNTITEPTTDQEFDLTTEDGEEEFIDRPWLRPGKWYVVHSQSSYEKKAVQAMQARVQTMHLEHKIYEIVIPMEDIVEFKNGRKQTVQKKMFPGYILVRCELDDDSWLCIRQTPGITGFVGQNQRGQRPTPLSKREVQQFLAPSPLASIFGNRISWVTR